MLTAVIVIGGVVILAIAATVVGLFQIYLIRKEQDGRFLLPAAVPAEIRRTNNRQQRVGGLAATKVTKSLVR